MRMLKCFVVCCLILGCDVNTQSTASVTDMSATSTDMDVRTVEMTPVDFGIVDAAMPSLSSTGVRRSQTVSIQSLSPYRRHLDCAATLGRAAGECFKPANGQSQRIVPRTTATASHLNFTMIS